MVHDNLTVVAIYGHNNGASVIPALEKSVSELPGSRGLLLSLERPAGLPSHIDHCPIFFLDYHQYSWFVMYSLHNFIDTDYVLIVQDDGWVLNGKNLTEDYYQYDYIGSITHCALTKDQYYYNWSWTKIDEPMHVIQNGGFSFRSKRFLEAPSKHGIMHSTFNVQPFCNEDVQLTAFLRNNLEAVGMKYAPLDVAKQFSAEYFCPGVHDDTDFDKLVGFHGQTRKLVSETDILVIVKEVTIEQQYRESEFLDFLSKKGYEITIHTQPVKDRAEEADQAVS